MLQFQIPFSLNRKKIIALTLEIEKREKKFQA